MTPPAPSFPKRPRAPGFGTIPHRVLLILILLISGPSAHPPEDRVAAWRLGIRFMDEGKVLDGIRLLDSLRVSGFHDSLFLSEYAGRVFRAFVPRKMDSSVAFLRKTDTQPVCDSAYPDRISWKVTKTLHSAYPCFQYGAIFRVRKPFRLVFTGLSAFMATGGLLRFDTLPPPSPLQRTLADEFEDRKESAECNLYVDLDDTRSPFTDYIARRITGEYDSIASVTDLRRYHALSLRCYRKSRFPGKPGDFAAYVVFDRPLRDLLRGAIPHVAGKHPGSTVRVTVAIRSGAEIQDFSEEKLESMLRAF